MTTKQTDALTLAAELRAGNWAPNVLQNEDALRDRAADELRSLHTEIESLRAGYDAARLEIASLQAQLEAVGAGGVSALMAAPAQPVDGKDSECEIPPLGWRCTRTRGHEGPCAAVESPEDKAVVERGMRRIRDAGDAGRYRLLKRGQHWSVVDGAGSTLRAEALDAAIDAAIAAQQGEKT